MLLRFTFLLDITLAQEELSARRDLVTQAIVVTWYVYLVAQAAQDNITGQLITAS